MKNEQFTKLTDKIVEQIRSIAPVDTGILKYDAIRFEFLDKNTCRIYVDENIVPYMPYTNEPWLSPRWHGKKNPNEGWWGRAYEYVATLVMRKLKNSIVSVQNESKNVWVENRLKRSRKPRSSRNPNYKKPRKKRK